MLLSDVRDKVNGTGLDFLGDAANTVAHALNSATKDLYQYHVYGPASNPESKAEVIPALQKNSTQDVTTMLQHTDTDRPITLLQNGASH